MQTTQPTNDLDPDTVDDLATFYRRDYKQAVAQLAEHYPNEQRSLELDWTDLHRHDPDLADDYLDKPEQIEEYLEEALRRYDLPIDVGDDLAQAHVRIHNIRDERTYYPGGFSPTDYPGEYYRYHGRGGTIDVEGSSAGSSLFGDDRSRKSGTTGYVRTVITDDRIVVKIPQLTGNDQRSVPYRNITSVDLDTGLVNKRLSLQTPGQTYHIQVTEPGKDEVREMVKFIREKMQEASQPDTTVVESEPDPVEQIDKLQELNEKGAISDEEFEEKKQDLLGQI